MIKQKLSFIPHKYPLHDWLRRFADREIAIIQSGKAIYTDNYGKCPLLPGDVFILRKPEYHGFSKMEKLKMINIIFIPERLALPMDELRKITGYNVLFEIEPLLHGGADRSSLNLSTED